MKREIESISRAAWESHLGRRAAIGLVMGEWEVTIGARDKFHPDFSPAVWWAETLS